MAGVQSQNRWVSVALIAAVLTLAAAGYFLFIRSTSSIPNEELDPSLAVVRSFQCTDAGAEGVVASRSAELASIIVEVSFLSSEGELLHRGVVSNSGMEFGEVRSWSIQFNPALAPPGLAEDYADCDAEAPRVFRFDDS